MQVTLHMLAQHHHEMMGTGDEYVTEHGFNGGYYIDAALPMFSGCTCGATCGPNSAHYEPHGRIACGFCATTDWPSVAAAAADLADLRSNLD